MKYFNEFDRAQKNIKNFEKVVIWFDSIQYSKKFLKFNCIDAFKENFNG
jgi:hypothetical protein